MLSCTAIADSSASRASRNVGDVGVIEATSNVDDHGVRHDTTNNDDDHASANNRRGNDPWQPGYGGGGRPGPNSPPDEPTPGATA